jgi:hypothetical protein
MINSTIMAIIDLAVLLPLKRTPNIRVVSMALRKKTFDFDR